MPELPEVEAVARALNQSVSGRTIIDARLLRERLALKMTPDSFARSLGPARINFVHRRGKHLLFDLDNNNTLITHLRMSGTFMLLDDTSDDPKFTHAVFRLDDGKRLIFRDQRHFGYMNVAETAGLFQSRELRDLAPEPFSEDFSVRHVRLVLSSSTRSIKAVLLDQTKFCGLGNIYASEALYLARINPATRSDRISGAKAAGLRLAILSVLEKAIKHNLSRPVDPNDPENGYFSAGGEKWLVYDRENKPCFHCGSPLRRMKQDGRSTFYCSRCQRKR